MIRTTRAKGGINIEVIRDDTGQVAWRKFVAWNRIDRLPEALARASREQERYSKKQIGESGTTGHGREPQGERIRRAPKKVGLPPERKDKKK